MMRPLARLAAGLLAVPVVASFPAPLAGQAGEGRQYLVVDQGSFTVSRAGERIGREEFRIVQAPATGGGGLNYVAQATSAYGDRRVFPALRTDSVGAPIGYQIEVKAGSATELKLQSEIYRGRVSTKVQTPTGLSAKEFMVSDGALILDDDTFHQYYFLAQLARDGAVSVLVPRRHAQVSMRLASAERERVVVGGRAIEARHLVLSEPGGADRDVWVDAEGRVLKVGIAARGIVALRDDPPR